MGDCEGCVTDFWQQWQPGDRLRSWLPGLLRSVSGIEFAIEAVES